MTNRLRAAVMGTPAERDLDALLEQEKGCQAKLEESWRAGLKLREALNEAEEQLEALRFAAEELYDDFARYNPPDLLPLPIQKIGLALGKNSFPASEGVRITGKFGKPVGYDSSPASDGSLCGEDKPGLQHASASRPLPSEDARLQRFVRAMFGDEEAQESTPASHRADVPHAFVRVPGTGMNFCGVQGCTKTIAEHDGWADSTPAISPKESA